MVSYFVHTGKTMATFTKVSDREKLKPRRDPYWAKIMTGCYLGYRKMTVSSEGSWSARYLEDTSQKQVYQALGTFDHLPDNERYDAAAKAARAWFAHLEQGGTSEITTIKTACLQYVAHIRRLKSDSAAYDAAARFERYVFDNARFATLDLAKLKPIHIEAWRHRLQDRPSASGAQRGQQRSDSSLNRDMTCLRAALNLAYQNGHVASDMAWRSKLIPVKDADGRRNVYLDRQQRRELIAHAPADLAQFLRGLCLLPLRPGALAALTVGSFDKRLRTLAISSDKAGQGRKLVLPSQTAELFTEMAQNKLPGASLFTRSDGVKWNKDNWKHGVKDAARAAKLGENVTIYVIRHSVITDLVHSGLDLLTVAQIAGTSVRMIEIHYGHLRSEVAATALAQLAL